MNLINELSENIMVCEYEEERGTCGERRRVVVKDRSWEKEIRV
jgi:hypothetical protein